MLLCFAFTANFFFFEKISFFFVIYLLLFCFELLHISFVDLLFGIMIIPFLSFYGCFFFPPLFSFK